MSSPWSALLQTNRAEQIALYVGSPTAVLQLQGSVKRVEVIETFGGGPALEDHTQPIRVGDALTNDGVTIWIEGYFPSSPVGEPVVQSRADILASWDELYSLLMSTNYELFLHYDAGATPLYRKYRELTTAYVRSNWVDTLGMPYQFAAISSNRTLYDEAPGLP